MALAPFIATRLRRLCKRLGKKQSVDCDIGRWGEAVAADFLRGQGYKILLKRFRGRGGEIDLVCRDGEVLAFVEVKARSSTEFGRPGEFVDRAKQKRLSKTALEYLRLLGNPSLIFRFDVVEVELAQEIEKNSTCFLIRNAFELTEPYLY
ncbi:MAG: YraN family protein [Verrucomicrobiae bacterium]|nr:YraN family protein [Verrucomicrobiae bacterium]